MAHFEIVAHRGIPTDAPENTVASFRHAVELGADAMEFDVRLTADRLSEHFIVASATIDRFHKGSLYPSDHYPVTAVLAWTDGLIRSA